MSLPAIDEDAGRRKVAMPTRMPPVASIAFDRRKYGAHLLADACEVASLPHFIKTPRPHRLAFYEIALITSGHGALALDGVAVEVAPYRLCLTEPGEIRSWRLHRHELGGLLAFFEADLFDEVFADPCFLDKLPIVAAAPAARSIALDKRRFEALADLVGSIVDELRAPDADTTHLLRAQTYQLLVAIQRASGVRAVPPETRAAQLARRFARLLAERCRFDEPVSAHADRLGVSVRHLNACVRRSTGRTAAETARASVHLQARRLLLQSDRSVTAIAETLGFEDVPYFVRFFKRHAGLTPGRFRAAHGNPIFDRARPLPDIET
jgi:AraC family transcriptional regulator, transcriptional activator of pobA